jgi:antitoxin component of MazEF toxin-antitoxin module
MRVLVRKVGNSLVITIPSDIANILNIKENDCVNLEMNKFKDVILKINRKGE